jgi:hypothetical protein
MVSLECEFMTELEIEHLHRLWSKLKDKMVVPKHFNNQVSSNNTAWSFGPEGKDQSGTEWARPTFEAFVGVYENRKKLGYFNNLMNSGRHSDQFIHGGLWYNRMG